jgi:hypothetical protein
LGSILSVVPMHNMGLHLGVTSFKGWYGTSQEPSARRILALNVLLRRSDCSLVSLLPGPLTDKVQMYIGQIQM